MSVAPRIQATAVETAVKPSRSKPKAEVPDDLLTVHAEITKGPHLWREALSKVEGPSNAYRVGIHLIDKCLNRKTGRCFPKQETIAKAIRMKQRSVRHGVSCLKDLGLIYVQKRSYTGPNDIFFYIPASLRNDTAVTVQVPPEVTHLCHTKRHGCDGGNDTAVADITLERTIEERTIEGNVGVGEVGACGGPSDSSSLRSEDLSCSRDLFEINPDIWEEGKYL